MTREELEKLKRLTAREHKLDEMLRALAEGPDTLLVKAFRTGVEGGPGFALRISEMPDAFGFYLDELICILHEERESVHREMTALGLEVGS